MMRYIKRTCCLKFQKTIKITHTTAKPNVIKVATQEWKIDILHKQSGVDSANIVTSKRQV